MVSQEEESTSIPFIFRGISQTPRIQKPRRARGRRGGRAARSRRGGLEVRRGHQVSWEQAAGGSGRIGQLLGLSSRRLGSRIRGSSRGGSREQVESSEDSLSEPEVVKTVTRQRKRKTTAQPTVDSFFRQQTSSLAQQKRSHIEKKQVRNLCIYSRPGDRFWPCVSDRLYTAKGPSSSSSSLPPSSLPYSANVNITARLSALAVRKKLLIYLKSNKI